MMNLIEKIKQCRQAAENGLSEFLLLTGKKQKRQADPMQGS